MRVTEIIIDGFKSYAVRTVIGGWDESFNSITGLNGSGKSNILDAICFVLGITNMSTVRAQNLQDLIYKRGQAGVTKASVTIVFDNRDTAHSPIGFEEYPQISVTRQVVLGGTSKYLINGHRAQQQTVQNLFHSVGLNINNPNFLIMQGRITKVLNMKAAEILAMIEEAAGTRMFEDRRDKALKTIAKKAGKLEEIKELLRDEIEPKLEKLRTEKRAFLDFQQTQNDLERLTRVVVAHDYLRFRENLRQSDADLAAKNQRMLALEESAAQATHELAVLEEDLKRVRAERERESRKGGRAEELEGRVQKYGNEVVRLTTVSDLKAASFQEDSQRRLSLEQSVRELATLLDEQKASFERLQSVYDASKEREAQLLAEVDTQEDLLQTLQTGVAAKDGQENGGYQGQLQEARNRAQAALTEQEQAKIKMAHWEARLKEEIPRAEKARKQNEVLLRDIQALEAQHADLERKLETMGVAPGEAEALQKREAELRATAQRLQQEADGLRRRVANIDFPYADPTPNFDRRRVKGLVAQLFTLDKKHHRAGRALEVCAGGRLYNVVVDSEVTGTQLLQHGKLKKRVTIIPLNKISAFRAAAQTIATAQSMAPPGKVELALSLVGFDDEISAAMEYVFGNTLICEDADTAKRVTFDPKVRMRSITLDGDAYDPSGTLSGGSAPTSSGVLVTLQQLNIVTRQADEATKQLHRLQGQIQQQKATLDTARSLEQQLALKQHEIKLAKEQLHGNSSSSILHEVETMQTTIQALQKTLVTAHERHTQAVADAERVEQDRKDFSEDKEGKLVELQKSLDTLQQSLAHVRQQVKSQVKDLQQAQVAAEQAESDLTAAREQLEELTVGLAAHEKEMADLRDQKQAMEAERERAQAEWQDEQAKLNVFQEEVVALESAVRSKTARLTEEGLERQRLGHEIQKFHEETRRAGELLAKLESEHEWIATEKDQFGRANTMYDFSRHNLRECRATLASLAERFQGMKKKINPKVMNMIDSVEKKEASLKQMMRTVIRDKRKIEETIVSLDEYKKKALQTTWETVNADFGQIFSELLPGGSFAKLEPPDGKTISEGLEVRVCLGRVWKQSLTELSGGQRSLVALSLILALLQFKPAPMYILDEVDAALDLSHTQNIGRLIKMRFRGSQFIVVSLKDGMFQNANRIFRTRFTDGTSVVQALTPADLR